MPFFLRQGRQKGNAKAAPSHFAPFLCGPPCSCFSRERYLRFLRASFHGAASRRRKNDVIGIEKAGVTPALPNPFYAHDFRNPIFAEA
jgi:hypothetical protein